MDKSFLLLNGSLIASSDSSYIYRVNGDFYRLNRLTGKIEILVDDEIERLFVSSFEENNVNY